MTISERQADTRASWGSNVSSRLSDVAALSPSPDRGSDDDHRQDPVEIITASRLRSRIKEQHSASQHLPIEILEYIFAYAAWNEIPGQGRTEAPDTLRSLRASQAGARGRTLHAKRKAYEIIGWVKLTHVCRTWRAIALADANRWLWTTMDTGRLSETGMRAILERSHPHPVTPNITLSVHPDELTTFAVLLEPRYLPRLKSLRLAGDNRIHPQHPTAERDMMDQESAMLCELVGRIPPPPQHLMIEALTVEYDEAEDYVFELPWKLELPLLRHLALRNAHLPWRKGIVEYPWLTHLEITASKQSEIWDYSIDKLVALLRGSPDLQVLRLSRAFPARMGDMQSVDDQNVETRGVHLLCLKELHLQGTPHRCVQFGRFLNLPESCIINVDTPGCQVKSPHKCLGLLLRRWVQMPVCLDISSKDDGYHEEIKVWDTVADPRAGAGGYEGNVGIPPDCAARLRLTRLPPTHKRSQLIPEQFGFWESVHSYVSLENVALLRVYAASQGYPTPLLWRKLLGGATAVRHVWVEGRIIIGDLVCAFGKASPQAPQRHEGDGKPLFPKLQSLSMRSFDHVALVEKHELRDCLQARKDAGVGDAMIDVQFEFSDGMVPPGFEASLAELNGLATFQIKTYL